MHHHKKATGEHSSPAGNGQGKAVDRPTMASGTLSSGTDGYRKVTIELHSEPGRTVFVAGSFNDWRPDQVALKEDGNGTYRATLTLPTGRHEYKFIVNGDWQIDPACQEAVPNPEGSLNSILQVQ